MRGRDDPFPRHLGDPNGVHWSIDPPEGWVEPDEPGHSVEGDVIRFMWDYGVVVPLWGGDGLLPDEPEWLEKALGISSALVRDLTAWGNAMENLDAHPRLRTDEAYAELDQRAKALVERLQQELDSRFTVKYKPW